MRRIAEKMDNPVIEQFTLNTILQYFWMWFCSQCHWCSICAPSQMINYYISYRFIFDADCKNSELKIHPCCRFICFWSWFSYIYILLGVLDGYSIHSILFGYYWFFINLNWIYSRCIYINYILNNIMHVK